MLADAIYCTDNFVLAVKIENFIEKNDTLIFVLKTLIVGKL